MKTIFLLAVTILVFPAYAQKNFTRDPLSARFITSDITNFWAAFDKLEVSDNPFIDYLANGSQGLKDFIPNRIESPKKLLKVVKRRQPDYEAIRENSLLVNSSIEEIKKSYQAFASLYDSAVFPTTYFVLGAFNTGGTASENGLIIGMEKQESVGHLPYVVAHELIHFNQNYPGGRTTLLEQSIKEGSADFIGELISGKHINARAFTYGKEYEKQLSSEFAEIMHGYNYKGWLYGSKGKKKGRPKDLGYWMGYKICEAYYNKSINRKDAIREILNIKNFDDFLIKSGYLSQYSGQ
jgi:predicted Zn-dependent protease DUF2268